MGKCGSGDLDKKAPACGGIKRKLKAGACPQIEGDMQIYLHYSFLFTGCKRKIRI
jgi:hypothetical protein